MYYNSRPIRLLSTYQFYYYFLARVWRIGSKCQYWTRLSILNVVKFLPGSLNVWVLKFRFKSDLRIPVLDKAFLISAVFVYLHFLDDLWIYGDGLC